MPVILHASSLGAIVELVSCRGATCSEVDRPPAAHVSHVSMMQCHGHQCNHKSHGSPESARRWRIITNFYARCR
eukprot:scaffold10308_cov29-Prasinocladus_malaysianus.AAC.1